MKRSFAIFALAFLACGPSVEIKPDGTTGNGSTGSSESTSSASSSSGQGSGGNGAGLSCDPCIDRDGFRLARKATISTSDDGMHETRYMNYRDKLRGEDCRAMVAEDGKLRCLPAFRIMNEIAFDDSECTVPLVEIPTPPCGLLELGYVLRYADASPACGEPRFVVLPIKGEHSGSIHMKIDGKCQTISPLPGVSYFATGERIAPSEFVEIQTNVSP